MGDTVASGGSRSRLRTFVRRIRRPMKLIDWSEVAIEVEFSIFKPAKLAALGLHRYAIKGSLAREDPGFFLVLVYLIVTSSIIYGVALTPFAGQTWMSYTSKVMRVFMLWPLVLSGILSLVWTVIVHQTILKLDSITNRHSFAGQISRTIGPTLQTRIAKNTSQAILEYYVPPVTYSFDLVCNASLPSLLILLTGQYFLLPVIFASRFTYIGTVIGNCIFLLAGFLFTYNLALGIAIIPTTLGKHAGILFVVYAAVVLVTILLTLVNVNINRLALRLAFGTFMS